MRTREQDRAAFALQLVDGQINRHAEDHAWLLRLRQSARDAPARLLRLGLATTLAQFAAQGEGSAEAAVFAACQRWLCQHGEVLEGQHNVIQALCCDCSQQQYFLAQAEIERLLVWLKKLAVARIDDTGRPYTTANAGTAS